jgi:hypothetical protein
VTSPAPREKYKGWVVNALRAIGPATLSDVYDWIRANEHVPSADLSGSTPDGENLFKKTVRWARKDLYDAGIVLSPARGIWSIKK